MESDTVTVAPSLSPPTHRQVQVRTPPLRPTKSESDPEDILPGILAPLSIY